MLPVADEQSCPGLSSMCSSDNPYNPYHEYVSDPQAYLYAYLGAA